MIKRWILLPFMAICCTQLYSQSSQSLSSSQILQMVNKLQGRGSVLYIAAHPDDENTRLLSYLTSEKYYRTGYLSITRGDGGQNLIGDEQGAELGMIRTRELMAARKVDGAEQFFTRAADFGYSKNPEEALRIWGHEAVLSDVVYVIRKFQPDVIITRFPTTGEGGHGHHTASAILAGEAFEMAGDPSKFPEHFKSGVKPWRPARLLWNTFNFGNTNTQRESQFRIDVGVYNPVAGRGYGEIAAESRSQHRSQGFGVPAQRGSQYEYFETIKGTRPVGDLVETYKQDEAAQIAKRISLDFDPNDPSASIPALQQLKKIAAELNPRPAQLSDERLDEIILAAAGIYLESSSPAQFLVKGDSARINFLINNRSRIRVSKVWLNLLNYDTTFTSILSNTNYSSSRKFHIPATFSTEPYWLRGEDSSGHNRALPWNESIGTTFRVSINGMTHSAWRPVLYRFTDPVRGELYQPVHTVPALSVAADKEVVLLRNGEGASLDYTVRALKDISGRLRFVLKGNGSSIPILDSLVNLSAGEEFVIPARLHKRDMNGSGSIILSGEVTIGQMVFDHRLRQIKYEHIPDIIYTAINKLRVVTTDIKTSGRRAGYIEGAGDKVKEALGQLGYEVITLGKKDMDPEKLKGYDVIVTGIRAYNIHSWLSNAYPALMEFVEGGGTLVVQYNTNNSIGPVRSRIFPYPFNITRRRVTDEDSPVSFSEGTHNVLNFPNRITQNDFQDWVQERSIYHADAKEPFEMPLKMNDPGENADGGALIVADHGKGRLIYTGISFFRQLPAGVPGAYRLFANLISRR